jgi:SAM-dependent methyltransferase
MAAWSDGYFTDIPYTDKFYAELAPRYLAFACLRQGVRAPRLEPGSAYLELGCGQGYGLNLLAAANPRMTFRGVDFHPGQIANARRLAEAAGLRNIAFEDHSFEQLLALPAGAATKFDVVALHGVYSWVSAESRAAIVRILDQVLKPGAMVYVSYNCLPGWAPLAPLQRFVAEHVARSPGNVQVRVIEALRAALQLVEGNASYFEALPFLKPRIEEALRQDPAYLVHEYLNEHSQPLYHADVARQLGEARLTFAASANIADDLINLAAPSALQGAVQAASDATWRETLLDYAGSKPFRRDVFVRGRNTLGAFEREQMLDETWFALLTTPDAVTYEFPIPIGTVAGRPAIYQPIVEALAKGPTTFGELRRLPALANAHEGALLQAVTLLVGGRQIHPVSADAPPSAEAFNQAVVARAPFGDVASYLAATLAGTAVRVDLAELFAVAGVINDEAPEISARKGWEAMARAGRRLVKDGVALQDQAANEAELVHRIATFRADKLPLFRSLGVV